MAEAAPKAWSNIERGVSQANRMRVVQPLGRLAMAVLAFVIPFAVHARHIVFYEHHLALFDTLPIEEVLAGLGDVADVLVAHD